MIKTRFTLTIGQVQVKKKEYSVSNNQLTKGD